MISRLFPDNQQTKDRGVTIGREEAEGLEPIFRWSLVALKSFGRNSARQVFLLKEQKVKILEAGRGNGLHVDRQIPSLIFHLPFRKVNCTFS